MTIKMEGAAAEALSDEKYLVKDPSTDLPNAIDIDSISEDLIPSAAGTKKLGSITKTWWAVLRYIQADANNAISFLSDEEAHRIYLGTGIGTGKYFKPGTDDTGYLGTSSARWKEIHGTKARLNRLEVDNATTFIDKDGTNNMTFDDAVTGSKTLAELATDTQPAKEIFIPATYGTGAQGATGDFPRWTIAGNSGQAASMYFTVPSDFTALVSAVVVVIPSGIQTSYDITTDFGLAGEAYNTNQGTTTPLSAVTIRDVILEIDFGAALLNLAAAHHVGVTITNIPAVTDTAYYVLGVRFTYG